MIIPGNKQRQRRHKHAQQQRNRRRALVLEGGPEHEARRVDHGQLVDELHGVFERGVEGEAAAAHDQVADEGEEEDAVVALGIAVVDAFAGEVDEEGVGEGVDDFGRVGGCVVVLRERQVSSGMFGGWEGCGLSYLFTPVDCGRDGCPVAIHASRRVRDGG